MSKAVRPKQDQEFAGLLGPIGDDAYAELRKKIEEETALIPLIVWKETGILLDGYNRLRAYDELGITSYPIVVLSFGDRDDALQWIINNQLARRNLTDEKRSFFRGKDYLLSKKKHGDADRIDSPSGQNVHLEKTAEILGEKHNVTERTIRRDAAFAAAVETVPPKAREPLLNGQVSKSATLAATGKKTVLCDRCERFQTPVKDCPNCAALKQVKLTRPIPTRKPSPEKQGRQTFDWKGFDSHFGAVVRSVDALAKAYPDHDTEHAKAVKLLDQFADLWAAWKKKVK